MAARPKRLTPILAAVIVAAAIGPAPAAASPAHRTSAAAIRLLGRVGRALRSGTVWTAAYRQEYIAAGMTAGETASGTVWLSWPNRALFRSAGPRGRIMGFEGRRIRLLDFESRTCDDHVLTEDEWLRIPLAAVLDPASATSRFSVSLDTDHRLVLRPLRPGGIARVELTLDRRFLPSSIVIVDPQGAVNRFEFRGWAKRTAPPEGGWLPAPPAGIVCTAANAGAP